MPPAWEATFVASIHAVLAWIVMPAAIMMPADHHPDDFDPVQQVRRQGSATVSTQPSESMPYSKPCTVLTGTISTLGLLNGRRSVATVMSPAPPRTNTI